jgi:serine/threonine protein kinase
MLERDPLIGQHLGAYQIQQKLGEGGMARVYKAYHARLRRDVAIKIILAHIAGQGDFRVRFEREAQLVASLEHPNIVAVYDFGEEGSITYLVMQYVGGGTLRDHLHDGYPLAPPLAAHYTLQMARALHSAHLKGIVHRDVKPQNMLVSAQNSNQLLLSDFGIAKLFDSSQDVTWADAASGNISSSYNNGQTSADQILGTLDYMAPEQINRKGIDARTDVYALGVVLFQMLAGRVPFLSSTTTGLMYQHVHTPPPMIRDLNPAAPEVLAQITATALQKSPEARFQSAEAMALALENALNSGTGRIGLSSQASTYGSGPHGLNTYKTGSQGIGSQDGLINRAPTNRAPTVSTGGGHNGQALGHGNDTGTLPGMGSRGASSPQAPSYGQSFYPSGPRPLQGQNTGATLGSGQFDRATTTGNRSGTSDTPPGKQAGKAVPIQMIVGILVLIVALILLVMRFQFFTGSSATPQTTSTTATAFTETFANNKAGWIEGNINGLITSVDPGHYTLTVGPKNTYFPYPAKIGALPANFTLTAQMTQDKGDTTAAYGIAFYLNAQNGTTNSAYAFIITSNGNYELLRYDANGSSSVLWAGQSSAIHGLHQSNTLQAIVRNGTFSFKINGQIVPLKQGTSLKDTTYGSGQLGLFVAGPTTQFTATKVQLAIP